MKVSDICKTLNDIDRLWDYREDLLKKEVK